jgi:thiamine-phosphate pyrophosphorylase
LRSIYRILDANFNRAREALRVIEDFARFLLDDAAIAAIAKNFRSQLAQVLQALPADELLAGRDTPGDVGTTLTSPTEQERPDAPAIATAACKRLSEALRTLEEYAKLVAPDQAARLEQMRYASYTLEQRLQHRLAAGERFASVRLYVLLTSRLCRHDVLTTARAVLDGGAQCLQLREKDMPHGQLLKLAEQLRDVTRQRQALFIMNDRADIAALVGADGVHVGQDDLGVASARKLLPLAGLVGKSTHNIAQAKAAVDEGADYIGVGPMFATQTKDAGPLAGLAYMRQVAGEIALPHVAIGGINAENVREVIAAGAKAVAVCSAVISAEDPLKTAGAIRSQIP